jgi:bacterioferritin
MKHGEKLIGRILFLEGVPVVTNLKQIRIGADVEQQFANDRDAELAAIRAYNAGVRTSADEGDNGTKSLLEAILQEEEAHLDFIEAQLDQIGQMGIQNFLVEQIDEE